MGTTDQDCGEGGMYREEREFKEGDRERAGGKIKEGKLSGEREIELR